MPVCGLERVLGQLWASVFFMSGRGVGGMAVVVRVVVDVGVFLVVWSGGVAGGERDHFVFFVMGCGVFCRGGVSLVEGVLWLFR